MCALNFRGKFGLAGVAALAALASIDTAHAGVHVLYAFTGGGDGAHPVARLIEDSAGNLYGTTYVGGDPNCNQERGCGTVFKLAPDGTETVLHAFTNGNGEGTFPEAGVIQDKAGNLYGTTALGGTHGKGTVFFSRPTVPRRCFTPSPAKTATAQPRFPA